MKTVSCLSGAAFARRALLFVLAACWCHALAGCLGTRSAYTGPGSLGAQEIVVVGRVELDPPLAEGEQQEDIPTAAYSTQKRMYVWIDRENRPIPRETGPAMVAGTVEAKFGESFAVLVDRDEVFVLGGILFLKPQPPLEVAEFPGTFRIDVQPGDRAVYVGTLRYVRNRLFEVQRVEVVDDFEREREAFVAKFGAEVPLVKRLLTPIEGSEVTRLGEAPAPGP